MDAALQAAVDDAEGSAGDAHAGPEPAAAPPAPELDDAFWSDEATRLYWWTHDAWRRRNDADGLWRGYDAAAAPAPPVRMSDPPWERVLDDGSAPLFEWFKGAQTNLGFNEVDCWILQGATDARAFEATDGGARR